MSPLIHFNLVNNHGFFALAFVEADVAEFGVVQAVGQGLGFGGQRIIITGIVLRATFLGTMQEIETFKNTGPTERELADVKEGMLRDYESSMRTNNYLLANITSRYQLGEAVEGFFTLEQDYRALTPGDLQNAARQYLNTSSLVRVTLVPER